MYRWQSYLSKLWRPSKDLPERLDELLSGDAVRVVGRLRQGGENLGVINASQVDIYPLVIKQAWIQV